MLKIALIGLGRIGNIHYNNLKQLGDKFKIIVLFDINQNLSNKYSEPIYHPSKLTEILASLYIDAVLICSPTEYHYSQIMECLGLGKHVFVEKPVSLSKKEIEVCFNQAEKQNLKLLVGFNRRFDPKIRNLKKKYKQGLLINLQQILVISRDYPYPHQRFIEISGGIFHDCIIHDLDNICWILEQYPESIMSQGIITTEIGKKTGHLDNVTSVLVFKDGITATLISSRIGDSYDQRIEFMGSNKSLSINNDDINYPISFGERYYEAYKNELLDFHHWVIDNQSNDSIPTKEQCLIIHDLTNKLEKAFIEKKQLTFDNLLFC